MKLNLTLEANSSRSGYVNINPLASPDDPNFIRANVNELGLYVDDGEAKEIIALDLIDYVPIQEKENIVRHWLSKLALGGTITIGGNDLGQITKAFAYNQLELSQAAELLYGNQLARSGLVTCAQMRKILEGGGLKIIESRLSNFSYYVKAERSQ
jgi:hypothetical protein